MKTFVFQGDSITDSGRSRDNNNHWHMGYGYPDLVASEIGFKRPAEFKFINRGVSGDKAAQMYSRIKADTIDLCPDYLSILIGVNDVWHPLNDESGRKGYSVERYTQLLSMFVEDVLEAKPDTVIAILEPFVLDGTATHEKIDAFVSGVSERAKAAKAVADGLGSHPDFPFYWFRAIIKTPTWYAGVRDELEILSPETVWMSAPEYFELLRCWLEERQ